ncbi:MAG: DNA adenine methylase, partial [Nitrospinaceae bacterium]|nr:DNA adenine methylase [Nitrospinaceae bacterium]
PGDFVYLDPPYQPLSKTASFTAYTAGGFGENEQRHLAEICRGLDKLGARFMLSNSDTPLIREIYKGFDIQKVLAARAINATASKRGKVSEVVVRNYT